VFKSTCRISSPESLPDLASHCREDETIVMKCYGYDKSYCPKTCSYSRGMEIKKSRGFEKMRRNCVYRERMKTTFTQGSNRR